MKQEFVTLPRAVVEQAIAALTDLAGWRAAPLCDLLRAALEQPQNHVPDAGNMVPAGWKLVPIEFTREMIEAGKDAHYEAEKRIQDPGSWEQGGFAKRAVRATHVFQAMLDAAPQPPTVKECLTVEQPQSDQPAMTPIAQRKLDSLLAEGYTISGYSIYHEQKHQHGFVNGAGLVGWWKPEGVEYPQPKREQEPVAKVVLTEQLGLPCLQWLDLDRQFDFKGGELLYTHPQPKREPLTDEQARRIYHSATHAASLAVFMTRMDAEHPDADDKGVSGWLQEAEDRVKRRIT